MIHRTATFTVKQEHLDEVFEIIDIFTIQVNQKEAGCLLYRSLQSQSNTQEFLHYMIFVNKEAEEHHRQTPYVKTFVDKLYPLLIEKPLFTSYTEVSGP